MILFLIHFHAVFSLMNGRDAWFPSSEGFGYEIDEQAGTITFILEDLDPMPYYLGIGWNNYTHDESYHTKTMTNAELMIWDGGSKHAGEKYLGSIWTYFGIEKIGRPSYDDDAMSHWTRTPGSSHPDGKPRWSRSLKRPEGCSKCIEIKKNQEYWVMSARGKIFDGEAEVQKQKDDPKYAAWSNWPGPRAGYHYAKTQREKVIIWKEHDLDDLNHMTNHHPDNWNQRASQIGQKDLTNIPQNSAIIISVFSSLLFFLGINLL
ncbi:Oidioi.mRNA.OKI2018_I69.chr1.g252.t1.cds [Oikopleura dioica]|uniref:Oidioi.mRNA.OKI2018_I69.chr1.g252.t1.cds n=1 Tax=Oikopleura dioica TaxID=34765 RepID=A0ABN7SN45_OIKDI|nr:Oidioi.mRNA.OKI2018_I69.chr1.g252.t1.cds [Oikopleura dioica]